MDFFTFIHNFLSKSFGIFIELPGQLLLVSKERLGVPIGVVLKKDFEFFGISFSLDIEYTLLKRKLAFDISVSKTFNVFGLEITPTIIVGKYGVAATLEVGANNYYFSAGIGFDRIPGIFVGARRGVTGFEISFGGGFPDEFQIYDRYKTFTVPLGIDFRGENKELARIPENSSYNTIDYINTGSGVLVPINNNLVPFNRSIRRRTLTVETPGGLVTDSFGFGRRVARSSAENEANRQAIEQIIKSQGGIAGDNNSSIVKPEQSILYVRYDGVAYHVQGDPIRAFNELRSFLNTQDVSVEIRDANLVAGDPNVMGAFSPGPHRSRIGFNSGEMLIKKNQGLNPGFNETLQTLTAYHETTHFLQSRLSVVRNSLFEFNELGMLNNSQINKWVDFARANRYDEQELEFRTKKIAENVLNIEAEAFASEFDIGLFKQALRVVGNVSFSSLANQPTYYLKVSEVGMIPKYYIRKAIAFAYSGNMSEFQALSGALSGIPSQYIGEGGLQSDPRTAKILAQRSIREAIVVANSTPMTLSIAELRGKQQLDEINRRLSSIPSQSGQLSPSKPIGQSGRLSLPKPVSSGLGSPTFTVPPANTRLDPRLEEINRKLREISGSQNQSPTSLQKSLASTPAFFQSYNPYNVKSF